MAAPESKIIAKVRKLLELADEERGGTEAERELATKRAQELMLKYNLASADLIGASAEGDVAGNTERIEGSMSEWKVTLALAVGGVSFVDGYYTKRARFAWDVTLIGRPDNVSYVKTLCAHLIPWLEQEATVAYKEAREMDDRVRPRSFKHAFYDSAIWIIRGRLHSLREQKMGDKGTELVRNEQAANTRWLEQQGVQLARSRKRGHSSGAGHAAGRQAGQAADLLPGHKLGNGG